METPLVQSVERALSLLEAVAGSADPVPLARLTEVLGIDQSSVFRLANTLKRRGFLANPNGRKHYVLGPAIWRLSRDATWSAPGVHVAHDVRTALELADTLPGDVMVAGGGEVYRAALPHAEAHVLTQVHLEPVEDVTYPALDPEVWDETGRRPGAAYDVVRLERRRA